MAADFESELVGQSLQGGSASRSWMIGYYESASDIDAWVKSYEVVPPIWGGLPIKLPADITEMGGGIWRVEVQYTAQGGGSEVMPGGGAPTENAPDHGAGGEEVVPSDYSWSCGGGTRHITQSITTIQKAFRAGDPADARNFGGAIGVNPATGEVAGVDVIGKEIQWVASGQMPTAAFTADYAKRIEELFGCVNSSTYFGYAAGECLLSDVQIDRANSSGQRPFSFTHLIKRNKPELVIYTNPATEEAELLLENVKGWSHVWVTYEQKDATVGGKVRTAVIPLEAYEEQVYDYADLNDLNIQARRTSPPPPPPP